MVIPSLQDVQAAAARIGGYIRHTPVLCSSSFDQALGMQLYFKCENLQHTGSFKIRGATNAVMSLSDSEAARGVATHSSGNHGAALAAAATARGIRAWIVVPEGSVAAKVAAIEAHGGCIVYCEPTYAARLSGLDAVLAETGAVPVHPYDDPAIIAGQGGLALELIAEVPELDVIIAPVGGGGLISGCAIAAQCRNPPVRIIGVEPAGADDTVRSLAAGGIIVDFQPQTVADGLRALVGQLNFAVIRRRVEQVITVEDDEILSAMYDIWQEMKLIVEPSSATVLAGLRRLRGPLQGCRVGVVLSGGNVDLGQLTGDRRRPVP